MTLRRGKDAGHIVSVGAVLLILVAMLFISTEGGEDPLIWGPNLGAIGEEFVYVSWNTSRATGVELRYAPAASYDSSGIWEDVLTFEPHMGFTEGRLEGLLPGTTYYYQIVVDEGEAAYSSPVGRFTTSSPDTDEFSFLVYGDTRTFPDRHKLVVSKMLENGPSPAFVVNTGDLVESPTIGRFRSFFGVIGSLALSCPYLSVIGNHERGHSRYYKFLPLPSGGGKEDEQWWSFDYGNVHFVGLDSCVLSGANAIARMREQLEWAKADLASCNSEFKVVFFHHPIYSSTWNGGVADEGLRSLWEPIFIENKVDIVFNGHMHCYEHFYVNGIHHVVTGGGGAPLQAPASATAEGTVFRSYGELHYVLVTVDKDRMNVEVISVATVSGDKVSLSASRYLLESFDVVQEH